MKPSIYLTDYFCPLCGDDAIHYKPSNIIEICIPCKRIIQKKSSEFTTIQKNKKEIKKYFIEIVQYELLSIALHPSRYLSYLEFDSFWIKY